MDIYDEIDNIDREISVLRNKLSSSLSDIGDWKINKIYEYRLQNKEDPYDFIQLCRERQDVRDKINYFQKRREQILFSIENE